MLFRIAPTPSGFLHLGNAVNFLLTAAAAKQHQADLLLRIDDLDAQRKRPEYVEDIFRVLDFLKIEWHKGPSSLSDFELNWSQTHRISELYAPLLERVQQLPALYACQLSRTQIAEQKALQQYPLMARHQSISLQMPNANWRLKLAQGPTTITDWDGQQHTLSLLAQLDDVVLRQRNGLPAYQVASLADDHYFGVTHWVRGADLLASSAFQLLLAQELGLVSHSIQHWHHPLLRNSEGQKLSKSAGVQSQSITKTHSISEVYLAVNQCLNIKIKLNSLSDIAPFVPTLKS